MTTPVFIIGHDDSTHAAAIDTAIAYGAPTRAHLIIVFVRRNPPTLAASTTATAAHEDALDAVAAELADKLHTRLAGYPRQMGVLPAARRSRRRTHRRRR